MRGFHFTTFTFFAATCILFAVITTGARRGRGCACSLQLDSATPGCVIGIPPAYSGFKCRCRMGLWSFLFPNCVGAAIPCSEGESCPANCASKECCKLAGGDCNGYDASNTRNGFLT